MNIEKLINKYFEGETTCEEERELKRFFTEGIVPEHLQMYQPMFAFFDMEKKKTETAVNIPQKRKPSARRYIVYTLSGIAAGLLLLIGFSGVYRQQMITPENYVIIDGQKFTDANIVHKEAMEAFREVSLNEEDVFATLFEE